MQVFVTGATGFIGHAVATAFARAGHVVHGLARSEEKAATLARDEILPVIGALDEPKRWSSVADACQVLVHCAAEHSARYVELDRASIDALLGSARRADRPRVVIYTSGVWVLGNTGARMVDESSELAPLRMVTWRPPHEKAVLDGTHERVRTIVIRPGCVYGGSGSLTASWFESATKEGAAQIVGDGENRWAMIHKDDLADLYVKAAESNLAGEVLHAVDRSRTRVLDCARAASFAVGAHGRVRSIVLDDAAKSMGALAEGLAVDQNVDASKAARLLGWQPKQPGFPDGIERYAEAWRAHTGRA